MPNTSPNLGLSYLIASQAQKHVTLNESLNLLDALVMMTLKARDINPPPNAPNEGERYLIGTSPTGAWLNQANKIGHYNNLGWTFITPKSGFICYVESENQAIIYNGADWQTLAFDSNNFQNLDTLGVGTTADNNNPFSLKAARALLTAKSPSEGGNGEFNLVLNKSSDDKNLSLNFQDNYSSRALMGLLGDDDFCVKVSNDGNIWKTALRIDKISAQLKTINSIDIPTLSATNYEAISCGGTRYLHSFQASGSDGKNLFLGLGAGNYTMSGTGANSSYNIGIGHDALNAITTGKYLCALGYAALGANNSGVGNNGYGYAALRQNTSGSFNNAMGYACLYSNTTGASNIAIGHTALYANTIGANNCAIGYEALRYTISGTDNINFSNCAGLGAGTRVSASNQVQLGSSGTTCYAYGAVQDRSDMRDKAEIRDTILGLEFINSLRPVDFKWDMRDDYFENIAQNGETENIINNLQAIEKDGSKKRNRFHHGLIAQEVKQTLDTLNIDFGGYQDHSYNGGIDVKTIGYNEFIAPLIKAIQELSDKINLLEANN